jgi:hypothetical protein
MQKSIETAFVLYDLTCTANSLCVHAFYFGTQISDVKGKHLGDNSAHIF